MRRKKCVLPSHRTRNCAQPLFLTGRLPDSQLSVLERLWLRHDQLGRKYGKATAPQKPTIPEVDQSYSPSSKIVISPGSTILQPSPLPSRDIPTKPPTSISVCRTAMERKQLSSPYPQTKRKSSARRFRPFVVPIDNTPDREHSDRQDLEIIDLTLSD